MPSIAVKDANGTTQTIQTVPAVGQGLAAASLPVVLASDQSAVPVSATALPLPTGAATGAKQDTGNTSLAAIATSVAGTLATSATDGAISTMGAKADTAATTDAGTFSLIALFKRLLGKIPALGSATSSASLPVVIASDQAAVAVSAAALPLPAGAATAAKQPALGTAGAASTDVVSVQGVAGGTPLPVSASTPSNIATNQVSVATTATLICAARTGRKAITVVQEGATLVRLGPSAVTAGTGIPLPGTQYSAFTIEGGAAVYGIVASGSQTVSYVESF